MLVCASIYYYFLFVPTARTHKHATHMDEPVRKRTKRSLGQSEAPSQQTTIRYRDRGHIFTNTYSRSLVKYQLSTVLRRLSTLSLQTTGNYKSFYLDGQTPIQVPLSTDLIELFAARNFVGNFEACWKGETVSASFGRSVPHARIPGLDVLLVDDVSSANAKLSCNLNALEMYTFRLLFCLLLNFYYGYDLPMCACYPKNTAERLLLELGLGKNCYSTECREYLNANMYTFDPLVHGNCDGPTQVAIVLFNNFLLNAQPNVEILQTLNQDT